MTQRESLSPMVGQPNPELERINGFQRVMLLVIAVGFIVLVGWLICRASGGIENLEAFARPQFSLAPAGLLVTNVLVRAPQPLHCELDLAAGKFAPSLDGSQVSGRRPAIQKRPRRPAGLVSRG